MNQVQCQKCGQMLNLLRTHLCDGSSGFANHIHNFTVNWRERVPNVSTDANTFYRDILYVCCSICGEVKRTELK